MRSPRTLGVGMASLALVATSIVAAPSALAGKPTAPPAIVYPNIIEAIPDHLQIQNTQQREWLRFSTTHINIGEGNLQVRGGDPVACSIDDGSGTIIDTQCTPATQELLDANHNVVATHPAGVAFFHPEHNHWHQSGVAAFEIRATRAGAPIRSGVK